MTLYSNGQIARAMQILGLCQSLDSATIKNGHAVRETLGRTYNISLKNMPFPKSMSH
jgi:hypothetical protein